MRLTDEPHEDKQGAMTHDHNKTSPEQYAQLAGHSILTGKVIELPTPLSLSPQMGQCAVALAELGNDHTMQVTITSHIADDEQPGLSRAAGYTPDGDFVEITIDNNSGTVVTDIKHDSTGDFGDDSLIPPED